MKIFRILSIVLTLTGLTLSARAAALPEFGTPFEINAWQFHDYDMDDLREAIRRAPEYGVNTVIFSHGLFRSVQAFLDSGDTEATTTRSDGLLARPRVGWKRDINELGRMANERGIQWYLWIHEFDDIPTRFLINPDAERVNDLVRTESTRHPIVNMDHPDLLPFIRDRYEKLLAATPGCAGLVVTYHESDFRIFRNTQVRSKLRVPDRLYTISKLLYDICKAHNKELIVRNFFYEPQEVVWFDGMLSRLPNDVMAMSKTTIHEFDPWYPPDFQHSQIKNRRQIIEIDLGVEKAWGSRGAYAQAEYIQRYVRRARDIGLAGLVGRAHFWGDDPWNVDTHEINFYAFSEFMKRPDRDVDRVLKDWSLRRFPNAPQAARWIASAMKRSQFIQHHGRWHLEFWMTKSIGSEWGDYDYYFGHILERSLYKWSLDPEDKQREDLFYHPTMEFYGQLVAEKDEVIDEVRAGMADLDKARPHMRPGQMAELDENYRFLLDAARLQREWIRVYFSQAMHVQNPGRRYKAMAEEAIAALEAVEKTPGITYGLNSRTGRRYNIDEFVAKMRERMADPVKARQEDERILAEVRHRMDVEGN